MSAAAHSPPANDLPIVSIRSRQPATDRGGSTYHLVGALPAWTASDSADPPSGSVTTWVSISDACPVTPCSFVVWLAANDRAGSIELLGQYESREVMRQRPWCELEETVGAFAHSWR